MIIRYDNKEHIPELGFGYFINIYNQFVIQNILRSKTDEKSYFILVSNKQFDDEGFIEAIKDLAKRIFSSDYENADKISENTTMLTFNITEIVISYDLFLSMSTDVYMNIISIYMKNILSYISKYYYEEGVSCTKFTFDDILNDDDQISELNVILNEYVEENKYITDIKLESYIDEENGYKKTLTVVCNIGYCGDNKDGVTK